MAAIPDRIEISPERCGGSPVVRGTRIPVAVILDQLAAGETWESLLNGYPELSREDIRAVLLYAESLVAKAQQQTGCTPIPAAEGKTAVSVFDFFGKAPQLRSAEDIDAQLREERDAW